MRVSHHDKRGPQRVTTVTVGQCRLERRPSLYEDHDTRRQARRHGPVGSRWTATAARRPSGSLDGLTDHHRLAIRCRASYVPNGDI